MKIVLFLKISLMAPFAALCGLSTGANASPLAARVPSLPINTNVNRVPTKWIGPVVPNGPDMTFNGNASDVHDQILALNPSYHNDFATVHSTVATTKLVERNMEWPVICNIQGGEADAFTAAQFAQATKTLGSFRLSVPGSPASSSTSSCTIFTCSYLATWWLCNDAPTTIEPAAGYIADYMENIIQACINNYKVNGQQFDSDEYHVFVTSGSAC